MDDTPAPPEGTPEPPQHSRHRWRRIIAKGAGLGLLLMLILSVSWMTRPAQVADLILGRVGDALGLEITSSGASEYNLGGAPWLVVRDLAARQPGADTPLLTADRVYLSLPWSTLRSVGAGVHSMDLTVRRVELDAPRLNLAALQRWRASRPPGPPLRIPTLTDGLRIERGEVIGSGWSLDALTFDLPSLYPQKPLRARLQGRFRNGDTRVPFDLWLALTRPAFGAGLGVFGQATVKTADWQMPMWLLLSGRLHDAASGFGLDDFRLGAQARYLGAGDRALPLVFGVAGPMRYRNGRFSIRPLGAVLRGDDGGDELIPTLDAHGALAWQDRLHLDLQGQLERWPDGWPSLPAPLGQSEAPLSFALDYSGAPDLSGNTALQLRREATRFDARFRLPQVLDWLDQLDTGTPLPPLDGHLKTPRLEIAGATLEGVEIEIEYAEPRKEQGDEQDPAD